MEIKQIQNQNQNLSVTQTMKQSLEILKISQIELYERVNKALGENPLLEQIEEGDPDYKKMNDISWEGNVYSQKFSRMDFFKYPQGLGGDIMSALSSKETFKETLREQLLSLKMEERDFKICEYIIELLDRKGFLKFSPEEIAEETGESLYDIEQGIYAVQSLEPKGVGASGIEECLILQLAEGSNFNKYTIRLAKDGLKLIAENKIKEIEKLLDCPEKEAREYIDIIKKLNPIPSSGYYTGEENPIIVPDGILEINEEGKITVIINDCFTPRLRISENISWDNLGESDMEYIQKKKTEGEALINGVKARESTLKRVMEALGEIQKDYLRKGYALHPVTMTDLAERLDLSVSTVSRVISEKYVMYGDRVIPLKSLMSAKAGGKSGNISENALKRKIENIIRNEDKSRPFSDEEIGEIFKEYGVEISRRTIAKHRQRLGIENAYRRKKF